MKGLNNILFYSLVHRIQALRVTHVRGLLNKFVAWTRMIKIAADLDRKRLTSQWSEKQLVGSLLYNVTVLGNGIQIAVNIWIGVTSRMKRK